MTRKSKTSPSKTVSPTTADMLSYTLETNTNESVMSNHCMSLSLVLEGTPPGSGELTLLAIFNGLVVLEGKWNDKAVLESSSLPMILNDAHTQTMITCSPLVLLLRGSGGKASKDPDPFTHPENRAGASVDLFPLLIGETEVIVASQLVLIQSGELTNCWVNVHAVSPDKQELGLVPLVLTMMSAHCLPVPKDGTVYLSAIGLNDIHTPKAINFKMSLSNPSAQKIVFAEVSTAGYAANTAMNVINDDKFIPDDLTPRDKKTCRACYWNAMQRVLVDAELLQQRLATSFMIEVAGVGRGGKTDVRGRYMGLVDARVLLEPGQMGVTVCSKLLLFNETNTPDNVGALLDLPPTSAKASARADADNVVDEFDHPAYVVIRFDLTEPLVPKTKLETLFETMGFPPPENPDIASEHTDSEIVPVQAIVDVNNIRVEGGALAVHKELLGLACKGIVSMNQGIKRTAANRLLMRVRSMLKSFPPGECSYLDWQETVMRQHSASRRAVTASFAPQPPPPRLPDKVAASRCRIAGDTRIADRHIQSNLKVAGNNPRSLIAKALRCLEDRNDLDAKNYLLEALRIQNRNRYLLWIFGGLEFNQEGDGADIAGAALRIAVKGDYSDGTANAIGWAALHAFHHHNGNIYAAFVAAKKMRKAFSLPMDWDKILERWTETSGEEEIYWLPAVIGPDNPIMLAAAFFLCLRCYKFSERLLHCVEEGCASRGSTQLRSIITLDVYYLRAASLLLRRELDSALEMTMDGIIKFGPAPIMSQMRATCLTRIRNWDHECELALRGAEKAGSALCSSLLYTAGLSSFRDDPAMALQRVARAHKATPSPYTALLIGRIYCWLGDEFRAERWIAAAVNVEPLLADGWAMLALMAMYDRQKDKARLMLRTARQVGPVSPDIEEEIKKLMDIVKIEQMPDHLVKNLCLCEYY
ncbi:uncharacterized protein LOC110372733 [Helicoverpa armigera]|uniref:uncharacterized protein LOC110372733 n=1 Tax=Helicoverpa armigera TaxID=29058 RepID=UPI003083290D